MYAVVLAAALAAFPSDDTKALPCRPTIACTADLVAPGIFEVEGGALLERAPNGTSYSTPFLLKLTLAGWGQLQVGSNGLSSGPPLSFDAIDVGLKLHLQDQTAALPSVSFSLAGAIPTVTTTTSAAFATAYVTKDLGWLHADFNLGLDLWRPERDGRTQPWAALALSVGLPLNLSPMLELYGFADAAPLATRDAGVLAALAWQPLHWLVIDAGADVGLIRSVRAVNAFVGFTVTPVDLYDTSEEARLRLLHRTQQER